MKKQSAIWILMSLGFLLLIGSLNISFGQSDLNAYVGNAIADSEIDGTIGNEWDDAGTYSGFPINPQGNAAIWIKQDGTNLYIAMQFNADSNNPWVAFQLTGSTCMTQNADGALFGHQTHAPNGYSDIYFGGPGIIEADQNQNGVGAINVNSNNLVTVEMKKPLNSGDNAGHDIEWTENNSYMINIMWDTNGGGSSGGTTGHMGGTQETRLILINPEPIPEIPNMIILSITAVIISILVIIYRKRLGKSN